MNSKKLDPELLRAMMMGDYDPPSNDDLKSDWVDNDLHHKSEQKYKSEGVDAQLSKCLKVLDKAIVMNKREVSIIHGIGSGHLKDLVHKALKNHPHVHSFELTAHNKGCTLVRLK